MTKTFLAALAGAALATAAHADPIATTTTPSGASTLIGAGSNQITFQSVTPGMYSALTLGGVTFTPNANAAMYVNATYAGSYNTMGKSLQNTNAGNAFSQLTFGFAAPADAFGFFFGASDATWTLTAFDSLDNVIERQVLPVLNGSNAGNFYGFSSHDIARATLVASEPGDYIFIDNFTYRASMAAVPEAATWAMMIAGFGAIGVMMRRRVRHSDARFDTQARRIADGAGA